MSGGGPSADSRGTRLYWRKIGIFKAHWSSDAFPPWLAEYREPPKTMTGGHHTCPLRARHRDNHLIVMTGLLPDCFRSPASVHSPVCFHLCDTEFRLQCLSLSALFFYSKLCNEPVSLYMLFFFFFAANRESEIPHYMVSNRVCHHALWCMWNHLCWEKKKKNVRSLWKTHKGSQS